MAETSYLRASDADRDAIAERLRRAAVEGRLQPEELEERLHAALRARTYGDLEELVADLPRQPVRREGPRNQALSNTRRVAGLALRVALTLALIAVALTVAMVMAAWWIVWVVIWFALRGRGCARPRYQRWQHGRLAGQR